MPKTAYGRVRQGAVTCSQLFIDLRNLATLAPSICHGAKFDLSVVVWFYTE